MCRRNWITRYALSRFRCCCKRSILFLNDGLPTGLRPTETARFPNIDSLTLQVSAIRGLT